jgi:type IV pilus assembly protein PilA
MPLNSYLQSLQQSQDLKPSQRGFTYIDLLVVLTQFSLLAAIAYPILLASMNRAQQAYVLERQAFAPQSAYAQLGLAFPATSQNYTYQIRGGGKGLSTVVNAASPRQGAKANIRAYIGGVSIARIQTKIGSDFVSVTVVCEALKPPIYEGDIGVANPTFSTMSAPTCPLGIYRTVSFRS